MMQKRSPASPPEQNSVPRNEKSKSANDKIGAPACLFSKAQFNLSTLTYFAMSTTDGHTRKEYDKELNMDLNDNIIFFLNFFSGEDILEVRVFFEGGGILFR